MNRKSKYIVVDDGMLLYPIIFPYYVAHAAIGRNYPPEHIISAGFVDLVEGRFRCFGESIGLRKKSRGEQDDKLINRMFE